MMNFTDVLGYSIENMRRKKLRSYLTILGIILGIATIVILVSVGEGVRKDINDQLEMFGADMITIMPYSIEDAAGSFGPGMSSSGKLFEKDLNYVGRVPGIEDVGYGTFGKASLRFKDEEINAVIFAATPNLLPMYEDQFGIEEGRYIQKGEEHVVFLMNDAANELFGKEKIKVNNYIYINEQRYRVVGIAEKIGTSLSQQDDSAIYVPYESSEEVFGDTIAEDELSFIFIRAQEGVDTEAMGKRLEQQLAASHRVSVDDKDFSVLTAKSIQETVNQITDILTGSLFLIGLISAVVGGIGIANTMFMSVLERTKEIGILKSIGATSWHILALFVVEAGLIGGIGGLIGLALGFLFMQLVPYFGIIPYLAPEIAVGVILFAMATGMVAGIIPARNASKIPAIEALRYD
ncbi:FtsX-like permease family protein [Candidatus Micrarchaeota archaeon]|nr:FtsX-like permease family protein [Candidatus Micrarchaeota archaeon]MBD3418232.1 FtsX-like permease family protein [Candidatus Micrarchaeota archaeon]